MSSACDESVMGKDVWVKCNVGYANGKSEEKFYRASIIGHIVFFPEDDFERPLARHHKLRFGDGNDLYYDLHELESTGYLVWKEEQAIPAATEAANAQVTRPPPPAVVVPETKKKPGTKK